MEVQANERDTSEQVANRYCASKGSDWKVKQHLGGGGTAQVFKLETPTGDRALKIFSCDFSSGKRGEESSKRLKKQIELGEHTCPYLVQTYAGGNFEDRLFLLMSSAPGKELQTKLADVPRECIPIIVEQIAHACSFLRGRGLCHRDIKSANIFVRDDFRHSTLLDASVLREINDPIGLGTDQGSKLPVVATSRYSPPEYLFRLIGPGPELWHALDIYQLGGLLHDLLMKQPMFEEDYTNSSDNKYRFAWIVATKSPVIVAADVPQHLVTLARRALDKDWKRRSKLKLEDFTSDIEARTKRAYAFIGIDTEPIERFDQIALRQRVGDIATEIANGLTAFLIQKGVTPFHDVLDGESDLKRVIKLRWSNSIGEPPNIRRLMFSVELELLCRHEKYLVSARPSISIDSETPISVDLPPYDDNANLLLALAKDVESTFLELAARASDQYG